MRCQIFYLWLVDQNIKVHIFVQHQMMLFEDTGALSWKCNCQVEQISIKSSFIPMFSQLQRNSLHVGLQNNPGKGHFIFLFKLADITVYKLIC